MKTSRKRLTRREQERATAQQHHDAAREPGKPWWEWRKLCMCKACVTVLGQALLRIAILSALALGCGSAQHATGPSQEALTADAQPHHPTEGEKWCPPPPDFPREIMLIVGDTCWVEVVATQAECNKYIEERRPYMTWSGRCFFFRYKKKKPQPTSSVAEPPAPVTMR